MANKSLIPVAWKVPDLFRQRLGNRVGRQRVMAAEGHLLLVLHLPPAADAVERQGRFIWRAPDGTWTSNDLGGGPRAVDKHLDEFAERIQKCDEMEERADSADEYFAVLEILAPLARATRHLHQVLQDARKEVPDDRDLINFRDRAYEIERSAELLACETQRSLDYLVARRAEQQAEASQRVAVSAHRLNMLAAFFLPLATLTAIFGTTFRHGWEQVPPPLPLLALVGIGLLGGAVLMGFVRQTKD